MNKPEQNHSKHRAAPKKRSAQLGRTNTRPTTPQSSAKQASPAPGPSARHNTKDKDATNPSAQTFITGSPLWTKNSRKSSSSRKYPSKSGGSTSVVASIFKGIFSLIAHSKITLALCSLAVILLVGFAIDTGLTSGKIYSGVKVGEVDLSGKTSAEAQALIYDTYEPALRDSEVLVYANEEVAQTIDASLAQIQSTNLSEQQSVAESLANKTLWVANADTLKAFVDAATLAEEALAIGRGGDGPLDRIKAALFGISLTPRAIYDEALFEKFVSDIDVAIGDPRVDFDIAVNEGTASVTEGHDGYMVDRDTFKQKVDQAFFVTGSTREGLVAYAEFAPLRITQAEAQRVCDVVNKALVPGAIFMYEELIWTASGSDIGDWITTAIVEDGTAFRLEPSLDQSIAKGIVLNQLKTTLNGDMIKVAFGKQNDSIVVHTDTNETIPLVADAVSELNHLLFYPAEESTPDAPTIAVGSQDIPATMGFDEAVESGIISRFTEFTTKYTVDPVSRQTNIHLVSELLSNSIIPANGGTWSFNETAGNCDETKGFQAAGAIVGGEYVDSIGGGICQVATTVFNSVYEAGFPFITRFNHSLYIASYPAGRDAAVSWPDLDLVWKNDSTSDVLLVLSYTDTSVTAALYGVNPEHKVSTWVGEWEEAKKMKTKIEIDESMKPGASYVKTVGADGRNITIVRTVKDKNGAILHEDVFPSQYDPKDEVKVTGPEKKDPASQNPAS